MYVAENRYHFEFNSLDGITEMRYFRNAFNTLLL